MTAVLVILLLVLLCLAGLLAATVWVLLPAVGEALERARIEREAAEASWQIHQRAAQAFGQMLEAAREADEPEGRG